MNIKITHNWLLDYLDTDAAPHEIQKYLSLSGPSIEKVEKCTKEGVTDYVYDIEITSNRIDMASVFGIAQEAQAILPRFGKKATIKQNPLIHYTFSRLPPPKTQEPHALHITIVNPTLCSRFTTIVLSHIAIKESPDFIKKRLELVGIKVINNVVDISNYLMVSLGQPTHIFDYDTIAAETMIMRESKKGERITTLDGKEFILPGGDIVIEDGSGQLIDLCGIMGGLHSSVTENTKTIALFLQNYNAYKIRKTSMALSQRTQAAAYFEKGLDEERVEPTCMFGIELLQTYGDAEIASPLYDIYPHPSTPKKIQISQEYMKQAIGVPIEEYQMLKALQSLGFEVEKTQREQFTITVPSWRGDDVFIKEDIVEEIARIYGYYRLPNVLSPAAYVPQPRQMEDLFAFQTKIKHFLKHLGLHEAMNYSMISEGQIQDLSMNPDTHLKIKNTISEDIQFLRQTLVASLVRNLKDNQGKKDILQFFEVAKIYIPTNNDLPDEQYKLGIAVNTSIFDLKGIIEALFSELTIESYRIEKDTHHQFFSPTQGSIFIEKQCIGWFGQLKTELQIRNELKQGAYCAEIDVALLIRHTKLVPTYQPINPFATIKLDITLKNLSIPFAKIQEIAHKISPLLQIIEMVSMFQNNLTLRFYFSSNKKNLTEKEAKAELENIKKKLVS